MIDTNHAKALAGALVQAAPPPGVIAAITTALFVFTLVWSSTRADEKLDISFDPILENRGGQRLSTYAGWNDAATLTTGYLADLEEACDYYVDWQVFQVLTIDEYPPKLAPSGWRSTDTSYLDAYEGGGAGHSPDGMDYNWLLTTPLTSLATDPSPLPAFDSSPLNELVADELIDEVILWGGPYFGYYESRMVGATAYWCNSPGTLRAADCQRNQRSPTPPSAICTLHADPIEPLASARPSRRDERC